MRNDVFAKVNILSEKRTFFSRVDLHGQPLLDVAGRSIEQRSWIVNDRRLGRQQRILFIVFRILLHGKPKYLDLTCYIDSLCFDILIDLFSSLKRQNWEVCFCYTFSIFHYLYIVHRNQIYQQPINRLLDLPRKTTGHKEQKLYGYQLKSSSDSLPFKECVLFKKKGITSLFYLA